MRHSYSRQEALADRLADAIEPIQITAEIADDIAKPIRSSGTIRMAQQLSDRRVSCSLATGHLLGPPTGRTAEILNDFAVLGHIGSN